MKRRLWRRALRGGVSLALALTTLWAVAAAAPAETLDEAARSFGGSALPLAMIVTTGVPVSTTASNMCSFSP